MEKQISEDIVQLLETFLLTNDNSYIRSYIMIFDENEIFTEIYF